MRYQVDQVKAVLPPFSSSPTTSILTPFISTPPVKHAHSGLINVGATLFFCFLAGGSPSPFASDASPPVTSFDELASRGASGSRSCFAGCEAAVLAKSEGSEADEEAGGGAGTSVALGLAGDEAIE